MKKPLDWPVALSDNDGPVIDLFHRLNLNLQSVKTELEQRVREDEIGVPIHTTDLVLNEKASNILKLAVLEARIQRTTKVDEQHLLLAILHDAVNNGAKQVLELNNMNYEDAMAMLFAPKKENGITNGIGLPDEDEDEYLLPLQRRRSQPRRRLCWIPLAQI